MAQSLVVIAKQSHFNRDCGACPECRLECKAEREGSLYKLKRPCIEFASAFSLATATLFTMTGASDK